MKIGSFMLAAIGLVSCKKDGSGPAAGPTVPSMQLVGMGSFKNTAKNGSEVASKLRTTSQSFGSPTAAKNLRDAGSEIAIQDEFSFRDALQKQALRQHIDRFLARTDSGEMTWELTPNFEISDGSPCDSGLSKIDEAYLTAATGLRTAADALEQAETSELPKGVKKITAGPQFAVAYSIDLNSLTEQQMVEAAVDNAKFSGEAMVGAGANASSAILGTGLAATVEMDGGQFKASGNIEFLANDSERSIATAIVGSANGSIIAEGSSDRLDMNLSVDAKLSAKGGEEPQVSIQASTKGNANMGGESIDLATNMSFRLFENSAKNLALSMTIDGQSTNVVFEKDARTGYCVVRHEGY